MPDMTHSEASRCHLCGHPYNADLPGRCGCPKCEDSLPPVVDAGLADLGDGGDPRLDIRQGDERDVAAVRGVAPERSVFDGSLDNGPGAVRHAGGFGFRDAVVNVHENSLQPPGIVSRRNFVGPDFAGFANGPLDTIVTL